MIAWEYLEVTNGPRVRRLPVWGGWLYQVEAAAGSWGRTHDSTWHPPVFVPGRAGAPAPIGGEP